MFGRDRLPGGVAVPSACFKILVEEEHGAPKVLALLIPQDVEGSEQPAQFLTSVEDIQRETRLDFFADLPAEMQGPLEHEKASKMW